MCSGRGSSVTQNDSGISVEVYLGASCCCDFYGTHQNLVSTFASHFTPLPLHASVVSGAGIPKGLLCGGIPSKVYRLDVVSNLGLAKTTPLARFDPNGLWTAPKQHGPCVYVCDVCVIKFY